ncbi:CysJI operon transcriptional activator [Ruegeria sp. THAF57]|uniref:LysR family transcriptional regulator n=1 Tax=Ruegeria sp. THAF57 TaxID=2744555 RepID=UPI0015DD9AED|nr:LysR family transcriptional regulator [Ruegeria sp. THAF57]CAD0186800.1 CysJI operon transcriptional activator [Ruegeria sp. THAF57]
MLNGITLKQLRSLKAVADTGSITDAAALQSLSPPAVHNQIKKLEEFTGTAMLVRGGREEGLVTTDHGAVLVRAMERIEGVLASACDNLEALGAGHAGHVTLGFETTGRYFAPKLIALLQEACPGIRLSFQVANRTAVVNDLFADRIDLAIMGRPPRGPSAQATPIGPHPYGLYAASDHVLAQHPDYDPAELVRQNVLAREPGSGTRIILERYLSQIDTYGTPDLVEFDSNETIKEAVIAGLGVAMLSTHVVQREVEAGILRRIDWPGLPVMRYWYLVQRLDTHAEESTARVSQAISDLSGAFLPN